MITKTTKVKELLIQTLMKHVDKPTEGDWLIRPSTIDSFPVTSKMELTMQDYAKEVAVSFVKYLGIDQAEDRFNEFSKLIE